MVRSVSLCGVVAWSVLPKRPAGDEVCKLEVPQVRFAKTDLRGRSVLAKRTCGTSLFIPHLPRSVLVGPKGSKCFEPLGPKGSKSFEPLDPKGSKCFEPLGPKVQIVFEPLGSKGSRFFEPLGHKGLKKIRTFGP